MQEKFGAEIFIESAEETTIIQISTRKIDLDESYQLCRECEEKEWVTCEVCLTFFDVTCLHELYVKRDHPKYLATIQMNRK